MYQFRHDFPIVGLSQRGGGEGTLDINGHRYYYKDSRSGVSYTILAGRRAGKRPCIILFYNSRTREADLQTIERGEDCSLEAGAPTSKTVIAAVELARKYGARRLVLTDNASKDVGPDASFTVSDMYMLTTGKSWYESIIEGLRAKNATTVNEWRKRVFTNTWNDVSACLRYIVPDIVFPVKTDDIDTGAPGSAMIVFRRIKDAKTSFYADYKHALPGCTGGGTIYGSEWYLDL